jgi:hypothetical protein
MAEGSKIKWGTIIAGAAIVAGVALVAPTLFPTLGEKLAGAAGSIAEWIRNLFSATPSATPDIINALTGETAQKVTGAALIGGGSAYLLGGDKGSAPVSNYEQTYTRQADESFAMKEDMRKMRALMELRAKVALAGTPEGQAMLAQQQGRA